MEYPDQHELLLGLGPHAFLIQAVRESANADQLLTFGADVRFLLSDEGP